MKTAMRREKIAEAFHREISLSKIMSMSICYDLKLNLFKKLTLFLHVYKYAKT